MVPKHEHTAGERDPRTGPVNGLRGWILGVPLIGKLIGANLLIALGAVVPFAMSGRVGTLALVCLALAIGLAVNTLLVRLALSPLDNLQETARRVSAGDFSARVAPSPIADRRIGTLGATINQLLDRMDVDRARIHRLAQQSLMVREAERAAVATELREATTQQLSALTMYLAAALREAGDSPVRPVLATAHGIAAQMVEEVQGICESVYPGLLTEMGLPASLEALGRRIARRTALDVRVTTRGVIRPLPPKLITALYRVAEEAAHNTERHAHAGSLRIALAQEAEAVRLEIHDDGTGFDTPAAEWESPGVGIFRARELLAHVGGTLTIASAPRAGTSVVATATVTEDCTQ